jgi:serine/threonine-protein kinase
VLRLLGHGGMGEVYLAERNEPGFAQQAALKVIKRGMDSQAIVRRFVRERQILARLDHPNLARLLDGGTGPDGRPYFALEWVDGQPITSYCRDHGLDLEQRLRLVQTVCHAVDSAHRRLVVHRDLKPANIMVTREGTAKLLDFGIAKLLAESGDGAAITQFGAAALTPAYAAPEQILGEPVSTATDVYSLGVVLYELITGILPHRRDRRLRSALVSSIEQETVERPSSALRRQDDRGRLARRVAGDLDLIVLTALHRDPARRYPSAQALADDLGRFLAGRPIRARPDEMGYRTRKFLGRHRVSAVAVTIGVLALVAGSALSLWEAHAARLAAARADAETARAERVKSFLISIFHQSDPLAGEGGQLTARELLERGATSAEKELTGEPQVQADLLDAVARIEDNLGVLDPAMAHAKRALGLRMATLPPTDGRIGLSRVTLGDIQVSSGHYEEGRRSYETAMPILVASYGADSLEVASALRGWGSTSHVPADRPQAIEMLRKAHAISVRHLGEDHVDSAMILFELAIALELHQEYPASEAAYRRAAALLTRKLGEQNLEVASAQVGLAGLLDRLGRTAEAAPLFEKAIATHRVLAPGSSVIGEDLFSYGILLIGEERFADADKALTESLAILGPDRFESASDLRYLGLSAMGEERYAAAADYFSRSVETYRRIVGPNDAQLWRATANLGYAHFRQGHVAQARGELEAALAHLEALTGPNDYELCRPLEYLGEVLTASGASDEAVRVERRVRDLQPKLLGSTEHRAVAVEDLLLAQAMLARHEAGDAAEARRVLDESLGIFARVHPHDVFRAKAMLESGNLALAEGNRLRAHQDLTDAVAMFTERKGSEHAETRAARRALAKVGVIGDAQPGNTGK